MEALRSNKGFRNGTHRLVAPERTLARIQPLARAMGITRVANVTGLDVIGIPVIAVMRPASRSISVAQGKGLDLTAAKVSGLMESMENFHAENVRSPLQLASYREMQRRGPTLNVERMPRIEGSAFSATKQLLWTQGHEVYQRTPLWVPFELVHTNYTLPLPTGSGALMMSDSGVASGNDPLEATSHAVCELVERDAVTLFQFETETAKRARRLDLDTVDDPACREVLSRYRSAGVGVAVWSATSDIGIPCFVCTIIDRDPGHWRALGPATGSGAHPSREIALLRALTEAAQVRLTVIAGSRDDIGMAAYRRGRDRALIEEVLAVLEEATPLAFAEVPSHATDTLNDDVAWELERLRSVGIEQVAVVDLSLPEFGLSVVRVVIPGLEGTHDAPGYSAGPRARARCS